MTETTEMSETSLRLERTYEAPAEEVFDAWTNPEVLRRWWKVDPEGSTPIAEVDLRVGGRYRLSMEDPSGTRHTVGGEYHEVSRPERLVYSWCWEQEGDGQPGHVSTVTVEFHADGERTNLVLEHTGLASAQSRDQHAHGWNACLDILQSRVFG
ncbi:MAG TPA: SRPBCC domain-containing protein [Solirubrobacteraceae bacterium]|nr:SRPBCC domain-containing protein [Solirubrobacteraceae bacterium]